METGPGVRRSPDAAGQVDVAIGDGVLAVLGGLTFLLSLALAGRPGLMGALLLIVVLSVLTGVATYTAVTGTSPSPVTRSLGWLAAVLGVVGVFFGIEHPLVIAVPVLALVAGMGRTRSWRWRLVGLAGVLGLLAVVWLNG